MGESNCYLGNARLKLDLLLACFPLFGLLEDFSGGGTGPLSEQSYREDFILPLNGCIPGGFMAPAREMTALIGRVRLRVSAPLMVVSCLSWVATIIGIKIIIIITNLGEPHHEI